MTIALLAAFVAVVVIAGWLIDRKDKRHDQQLSRLLVHVQAPREAVAHATSAPRDGLLYLPPEDDEAWNDHHRVGD
jgi:hypothetical protein